MWSRTSGYQAASMVDVYDEDGDSREVCQSCIENGDFQYCEGCDNYYESDVPMLSDGDGWYCPDCRMECKDCGSTVDHHESGFCDDCRPAHDFTVVIDWQKAYEALYTEWGMNAVGVRVSRHNPGKLQAILVAGVMTAVKEKYGLWKATDDLWMDHCPTELVGETRSTIRNDRALFYSPVMEHFKSCISAIPAHKEETVCC